MTREEAHTLLEVMAINITGELAGSGHIITEQTKLLAKQLEAIDMAIEVLKTDIVRCESCKYQDECEEVVLFEVTDDEVIGHRVHWCSYGRSK